MEAYFHNDQRIQEWIDQIIEKNFTVCLLTGSDSETEFQKGCHIVMKLASLLKNTSTIPPEYLADGLKQLIEQRLPDARVTNNFPTYRGIMDRMLKEGLLKVTGNHQAEIGSQNCSKEELKEEHIEESLEEYLQESLEESSMLNAKTLISEDDEEIAIPAFAKVNDISKSILIVDNDQNNMSEVMQKQIAPLERVLNNLFPMGTINYNTNIKGQTFIAQVENILISMDNPKTGSILDVLYREGWKVFQCSAEDLKYPRRLERGLKQILRSPKKS